MDTRETETLCFAWQNHVIVHNVAEQKHLQKFLDANQGALLTLSDWVQVLRRANDRGDRKHLQPNCIQVATHLQLGHRILGVEHAQSALPCKGTDLCPCIRILDSAHYFRVGRVWQLYDLYYEITPTGQAL